MDHSPTDDKIKAIITRLEKLGYIDNTSDKLHVDQLVEEILDEYYHILQNIELDVDKFLLDKSVLPVDAKLRTYGGKNSKKDLISRKMVTKFGTRKGDKSKPQLFKLLDYMETLSGTTNQAFRRSTLVRIAKSDNITEDYVDQVVREMSSRGDLLIIEPGLIQLSNTLLAK